ncbi:MAG TPA: hypothetical protein VE090_03440 [Methylomirabilota bacterium]|nr:hypothetical protein [Methylomirabilota bacterium]
MSNTIVFNALSDLLINLSAGWFGAAFIIPITVAKGKKNNLWYSFV